MSKNSPDVAKVLEWTKQLREVLDAFPEGPDDLPDNPQEAVEVFNQAIRRGLAIAAVHERFGFATVEEFRSDVLRVWHALPRRKLSKGEVFCIATSALYRNDFRFSSAGEKDTRMQSAMHAADIIIRAANACSNDDDEEELRQQIERHYNISQKSERDDEAVRKSVQRFKKKIKGEVLFRFNEDTFRLELVANEERLHGLTDKPGRPRIR